MASAANDQEVGFLGRLQKRQLRSTFRNRKNDVALKGIAEDLMDRGIKRFPSVRTGMIARPDTIRKDRDLPGHQDVQCGACQLRFAGRPKERTLGSFRTVNPN